jgi:integrase
MSWLLRRSRTELNSILLHLASLSSASKLCQPTAHGAITAPGGGRARPPTFHSLRHSHATALIADGMDVAEASPDGLEFWNSIES